MTVDLIATAISGFSAGLWSVMALSVMFTDYEPGKPFVVLTMWLVAIWSGLLLWQNLRK